MKKSKRFYQFYLAVDTPILGMTAQTTVRVQHCIGSSRVSLFLISLGTAREIEYNAKF